MLTWLCCLFFVLGGVLAETPLDVARLPQSIIDERFHTRLSRR
jgi:hypothetical protein